MAATMACVVVFGLGDGDEQCHADPWYAVSFARILDWQFSCARVLARCADGRMPFE